MIASATWWIVAPVSSEAWMSRTNCSTRFISCRKSPGRDSFVIELPFVRNPPSPPPAPVSAAVDDRAHDPVLRALGVGGAAHLVAEDREGVDLSRGRLG